MWNVLYEQCQFQLLELYQIHFNFIFEYTIILFPPEMTKLIFVCCNFSLFSLTHAVNEENQATITGMHILFDTTL